MNDSKFLFPLEWIDSSFCEKNWIKFRPLCIWDYEKWFCNVLKGLTSCDTDGQKFMEIFEEMYDINKVHPQYFIVVWEDIWNWDIVLAWSIVIENKFIHGWRAVGHIEDIVVSKDFSGKWLGRHLINILVDLWKKQSCYKVILDCTDDVLEFYKSCGFEQKNLWMAIYF